MRDWTGGFIADGLINERLTNTDCAIVKDSTTLKHWTLTFIFSILEVVCWYCLSVLGQNTQKRFSSV